MDEKRLREGSNLYRLKCLIKDIFLYSLPAVLVPLANFITIPILTNSLSKGEFGAVEILMSYVAVFATMATMGQDSSFARYYYQAEDVDQRHNVLRLTLLITLSSAAVILIGLFSISFIKPSVIPKIYQEDINLLFLLAALIVPLVVWFNFTRIIFKWLYHRLGFVIVSSAYPFLLIVLYYILVFKYRTAESALLAQIISYIFAAVLAFLLFRHYLRNFKFMMPISKILTQENRSLAISLLKYGLPYVCIGLFSGSIRAIDKTIIGSYHSISEVAVYSVGFKIASLLLFVETVFNMAWGPMALSIYKQEDSRHTYNAALLGLSVVLSVVLFAGYSFAESIVLYVSSSEYLAAAIPLKILTIGFVAQALAGVAGIGIELSKKTYLLVVSWAIGFAFSVIALYAMVPHYGIVGAAFAISCGMLLESMFRSWLAYKAQKISFDIASVGRIFATPIVLIFILESLERVDQPITAFEKLLLLILVLLISSILFIQRVIKLPKEKKAELDCEKI